MRTIFSGNTLNAKSRLWLIIFLLSPFSALFAQPEGETDTASGNTDYYDENIDLGDFAYGDEKDEDKPKKAEKKPYVRIVMPTDSLTELITYDSVIEQADSYYDSLYIRAKRWVTNKWYAGKKEKELVKLFSDDVLYEKFKVKVSVPMKVRYNKYSASEYGVVEFNLTMRFKDGKYKYIITNMVHRLPETSDKKDINYVYLEYYMKSDRNIVTYDRFLRGADAAVRKVTTEMTKVMREPRERDDDDW